MSPTELTNGPDAPSGDAGLPLVTIITPVYNAVGYISETVESVLAQDYPNIDYIVLNDGSTDATAKVLERYAPRIRLISHPNMGEARTVNRGIELARSDIVAVVNADDPILPGLARAAARMLASRPELVAVYPDWARIDTNGRVMEEVRVREFDYHLLLEQLFCIPGPGAFFRKSALAGESVRNSAYRYSSDYELWLRLGLRGPFARIPGILATWREHEGGASQAARNAEMAANKIDVVKDFFCREDLPEDVRHLRSQALSTAYYCAAILSLFNTQIPGRAYMLRSLRYAMHWPDYFCEERRRSWRLVLFALGLPLTRPLKKLYLDPILETQLRRGEHYSALK